MNLLDTIIIENLNIWIWHWKPVCSLTVDTYVTCIGLHHWISTDLWQWPFLEYSVLKHYHIGWMESRGVLFLLIKLMNLSPRACVIFSNVWQSASARCSSEGFSENSHSCRADRVLDLPGYWSRANCRESTHSTGVSRVFLVFKSSDIKIGKSNLCPLWATRHTSPGSRPRKESII